MSEIAERLHDSLQEAICAHEDEGSILVGWCVTFEIMNQEGRQMAGFFIGPTTTPWKALGLMDWAMRLIHKRHIDSSD